MKHIRTQIGRTVAIWDTLSPDSSCRPTILPASEADKTPAVKAFVAVFIDRHATRLADLERQIQALAPQNSRLPQSSQHP